MNAYTQKEDTNAFVSTNEWEKRLGQKGVVLWFTGLSGSGKTTIARALQRKLFDNCYLCQVLDGDELRKGLSNGLGFSTEDREENIRRTAEVAKLMADSGIIVIAALISPTQKLRSLAKDMVGAERFFEIFIDTPLEVCEQRDVKGLYKKARSGELKGFTGIDSPFERSNYATLIINANFNTVEISC